MKMCGSNVKVLPSGGTIKAVAGEVKKKHLQYFKQKIEYFK